MTIAPLREFLRRPDCIIFVGSGISMWSGLPGWGQLLSDLADHVEADGQPAELVRREIAHGDLLQAASYGASKLTPTSFATFIRNGVQLKTAAPHQIHKAIVELGPTGFITTNYDALIEQALRAWRPDTFFPPPVTNRHLVELAEIVSARSSHFIFKPHGDANDLTSIILTREQYRLLLPGGERHNTLEALKTLLVTRPVLYLGFGLRDPDFMYLRDLLLNIYQGAVRDHWAIMPDVNSDEADYWRGQYGIKLHGYSTHEGVDRSRDHRDLLPILQALTASASVAFPGKHHPAPGSPSQAERLLALTRYASGVVRRFATTNDPIEVRISPVRQANDFAMRFVGLGSFEGWTTTRYLTKGPQAAYLIGLPGAGKSFAFRLAARQLATRLQEACMDDTLTNDLPELPILVDLKLYRGDLRAQIASELPAGFTLEQLRGKLPLKLLLDAFNEMPSEYLESGALFASLDALRTEIGPFALALASRTTDEIASRLEGNTVYEIDRFDEQHVDEVLGAHGIKLEGAFADDTRAMLSRPFFLQLITKKLAEVPKAASPRDLYRSFISKLQADFTERFGGGVELISIFSRLAYRVIEAESEAFPLSWITDLLISQIGLTATLDAAEIANWLIARQVLTLHSKRRASFVHQSITEYCAASELARRVRVETVSLREIIASKKWDQCLYLALALMEPKTAEQVLQDAIETDFRLAVNAVRYAEEGQSTAVSRILETVIERASHGEPLWYLLLSRLPIGPEHLPLLNQIIKGGNSPAAEAVKLLAQLKGPSIKPELLDLLQANAGDFNFSVNGIARALKPMLCRADISRLLKIADIWQTKGDRDDCSAISDLLSFYDPATLLDAIAVPIEEMPPVTVSLLANALWMRDDDESFHVLAQLLLWHPTETTSDLALAIGHGDSGTATKFDCLNHRHVEAIWIARFSAELWNGALLDVCRVRPDLVSHVSQMGDMHTGIEAIILKYYANVENITLFSLLEQLLSRDDSLLKAEPFAIFPLRNLDWRDRELLFTRSLARNLPQLRKALLESVFHPTRMRRSVLKLATLKPVIELAGRPSDQEMDWFARRELGELVAHLGDKEVRDYCLAALTAGPDWLRDWVKAHYLHKVDDLTSDALDEDMISALMADLNVPKRIERFGYNPLGHLATDRLVIERLLPLAETSSVIFRGNLELVLAAAGDRHGKRYRVSR